MPNKKPASAKKRRDKTNRDNPRGNKKGGGRRRFKKQSPMARWISVNKDWIGINWTRIKDVSGI